MRKGISAIINRFSDLANNSPNCQDKLESFEVTVTLVIGHVYPCYNPAYKLLDCNINLD